MSPSDFTLTTHSFCSFTKNFPSLDHTGSGFNSRRATSNSRLFPAVKFVWTLQAGCTFRNDVHAGERLLQHE
jgi:hypothetical protein